MCAAGKITQDVTQQEYLTTLREYIARYFDEGELRSLCFDLGVRYDDLQGVGNASKARELVAYLYRHDRIPKLEKILRETRPDVSWADTSAGLRQTSSIAQDHLDEVFAKTFQDWFAHLYRLQAQAARVCAALILVSAFLTLAYLMLASAVAVALVVIVAR